MLRQMKIIKFSC